MGGVEKRELCAIFVITLIVVEFGAIFSMLSVFFSTNKLSHSSWLTLTGVRVDLFTVEYRVSNLLC